MTETLRDLSDYDPDPINFAGLAGVTHKATEGTMPHTAAMGTRLAARLNTAKADGLPVLGSYHVLRTPGNGGAGSLADQLAYWVARLDDQVPWWRTWPHWVLQIDAEKWGYDNVSAATVLQFAALLADSELPGWKVTYASRGQYGDSLTGIATPMWNADYRGNSSYLGDDWTAVNGQPAGWAPYSGQTPVLLQWNGAPDLDAFRGSLADLLNLTGGNVDTVIAWNTGWRLQRILEEQDPIVVPANTDIGAPGFSEPNLPLQRQIALEAKVAALTAPAPVDTHAVATDVVTQLQAAGLLTSAGAHDVVKQVLDSALTAGAQAA